MESESPTGPRAASSTAGELAVPPEDGRRLRPNGVEPLALEELEVQELVAPGRRVGRASDRLGDPSFLGLVDRRVEPYPDGEVRRLVPLHHAELIEERLLDRGLSLAGSTHVADKT